jgi:hypothetical protein
VKLIRFFSLVVCNAVLTFLSGANAQPLTWTTIAGVPGLIGSGDGLGPNASFFQPWGVAAAGGNLYVADTLNDTIRKLTPAGTSWQVTTLAGDPYSPSGFVDGNNSAALFNSPAGLAVDTAGSLYIADFNNNAIRKATPSGPNWVVSTIAGDGTRGTNDGTGTAARFYHPTGVALDVAGNVYVADEGNNTIRKMALVSGNWVVTTIAGRPGLGGTVNGTNNNARFFNPWGIALGSGGVLYVTDFGSSLIRKVTPSGANWIVTTIAGSSPGSIDGSNASAQFNYPMGLTIDSSGTLYIADFLGSTIRKLALSGTNWVSSTIGGSPGVSGNNDGTGSGALFNLPRGLTADGANLYVVDTGNDTVRFGVPAITLQISLSGNQIILTCPSAAANFVLETTPALNLSPWSPVTSGVTISGNNFILPRNPNAPPAFFRLRVGEPAITLKISLSGNQFILTCPSAAANFVLETTPALNLSAWSPVTSGVTVSGNDFILPRNPNAPPAFFRLRK